MNDVVLEASGLTKRFAEGRLDVTVLQGVDLSVRAGETLAIVGPSGSGKSSLIRHIVGVWPAIQGTVRIDGADIQHWNNEQLGAYVGYLPQEVRLFGGTIAENICRFTNGPSDMIVEAAKLAGVHDLVLRLPDGYETQVGENGQQLSGGQRQRVGLARALYGSPKLVVLDEPNSNLDSDGEAALTEAIKALKKRAVTIILVTHKTNLLAVSDKVIVMRDGTVQAFTTPQELFRPVNAIHPEQSLTESVTTVNQRA